MGESSKGGGEWSEPWDDGGPLGLFQEGNRRKDKKKEAAAAACQFSQSVHPKLKKGGPARPQRDTAKRREKIRNCLQPTAAAAQHTSSALFRCWVVLFPFFSLSLVLSSVRSFVSGVSFFPMGRTKHT